MYNIILWFLGLIEYATLRSKNNSEFHGSRKTKIINLQISIILLKSAEEKNRKKRGGQGGKMRTEIVN